MSFKVDHPTLRNGQQALNFCKKSNELTAARQDFDGQTSSLAKHSRGRQWMLRQRNAGHSKTERQAPDMAFAHNPQVNSFACERIAQTLVADTHLFALATERSGSTPH